MREKTETNGNPSRRTRPTWRWLAAAAAFVCLAVALCNAVVFSRSRPFIFRSVEAAPPRSTVVVLGARVYPNGGLSPMLADRVLTALDLYRAGKAERFLISGDHGTKEYDEVNAMKDFLLETGVDGGDIFLDHAGFDTYDTMYRARDVFGANSVVVVTQSFHLPRAVFVARSLGLDAVGVAADRQPYVGAVRNGVRESLARVKAVVDVARRAKPRFLGARIPLDGDARASWDR